MVLREWRIQGRWFVTEFWGEGERVGEFRGGVVARRRRPHRDCAVGGALLAKAAEGEFLSVLFVFTCSKGSVSALRVLSSFRSHSLTLTLSMSCYIALSSIHSVTRFLAFSFFRSHTLAILLTFALTSSLFFTLLLSRSFTRGGVGIFDPI